MKQLTLQLCLGNTLVQLEFYYKIPVYDISMHLRNPDPKEMFLFMNCIIFSLPHLTRQFSEVVVIVCVTALLTTLLHPFPLPYPPLSPHIKREAYWVIEKGVKVTREYIYLSTLYVSETAFILDIYVAPCLRLAGDVMALMQARHPSSPAHTSSTRRAKRWGVASFNWTWTESGR